MDHAVRGGIRYSARSDSKISRNPAPSSILSTATTRAASTRRRRGSNPPCQVLREHGQTLLGLVIARQSDRQQCQRLPGAVLIGDDMGADLVVQQGPDAVRPDSGGFGDEQPAERHHQLGDVLAHLDVNREVRIHGTVSIELLTSRFRERPGGDALGVGSSGRDGFEELLRSRRQGRRDPSVELQRPVQEPGRVAILQGRDLSGDLVSLRPEQRVQRRVSDVLDLEAVEVTSDQVRLELQWPEPQSRSRRRSRCVRSPPMPRLH